MPKQDVFLPKPPTQGSRKIEFKTIPKLVIDHTIKIPRGVLKNEKSYSYDNGNRELSTVANLKPEYAGPDRIPSKSESFFNSY